MFTPDELNGLYRYCLALTKDPGSAYDLLHQGIVRLLERGTDGVTDRRAFLIRIVRNAHFDHRKSGTARFEVIDGDAVDAEADRSATPIDDVLIRQEEVAALLSNVTDDERELLFLTAVEERTAQEVADLLDLPRGTILARLHRLRKRIAAKLPRGQTGEATR